MTFTRARLLFISALLCVVGVSEVFGQGTAFTYHGRLNDGASPASGSYDLTFKLFNALTSGVQAGATLTNSAASVNNGLFTVTLDFGSGVFDGNGRWLEIGVRTNGGGAFTNLAPRQQITTTPYAMRALAASNLLGTLPVAQLTGTVPLAQLPAPVVTNNATGLNLGGAFSGNLSGNGGGVTNLNASQLTSGTVADARLSANVARLNGDMTFSGTITANGFNGQGAVRWQSVSGTNQQSVANSGYVINNSSLVTVTLPASIFVGEVVRVCGVGAGGWRISQNLNQFISTSNLAGNLDVVWAERATVQDWSSIASSADGTKLVAGVQGGRIHTSPNSGLTWTGYDENRNWSSAASSADGTKLVAGTYGDQIYTSTNSGLTWTARDSIRQWYSVASSTDGTKLVAVVNMGQIYTSANSGATWTPRESNRDWNSVASSADGTKLVAVAAGAQVYTSVNSGVSWAPQTSSRIWVAVASSADGTKLVAAVNTGQLYTSTNSGTNWIARDSNRNWVTVASSADGSKLIAGVLGGQIYTSTDSGVTWTARESSRNWRSVTASADGRQLGAVGYGNIYISIPSSVPSTTPGTAGYLLGNQNSAIELLYVGSNRFIPLSHEGLIQAF
jgi:predicted RNA-binding Zn ribbon-like protein